MSLLGYFKICLENKFEAHSRVRLRGVVPLPLPKLLGICKRGKRRQMVLTVLVTTFWLVCRRDRSLSPLFQHNISPISNDDRFPLGSPGSGRLSQTNPAHRYKPKGNLPVQQTHRKTRAKNPKTKSPSTINIPRPPRVSTSESHKLHSLGVGGLPLMT